MGGRHRQPHQRATKARSQDDQTRPNRARRETLLKTSQGHRKSKPGQITEPTDREGKRDGSVHVPRKLSPLRLKAGADQCSESDGPTGQVASEEERTRLFVEPWFLVRLPPRPRSQNGGMRRTKDRGQRVA